VSPLQIYVCLGGVGFPPNPTTPNVQHVLA
jgi:hypothetical protein